MCDDRPADGLPLPDPRGPDHRVRVLLPGADGRDPGGAGHRGVGRLQHGRSVLAAHRVPALGGRVDSVVGKLGDIYGRGRILSAVLLIFSAGGIVNVFADSIGVLIAGRVLQGVAGGVFPLAFGIVRDTFPRDKVPARWVWSARCSASVAASVCRWPA